jgi:hypothetical protein
VKRRTRKKPETDPVLTEEEREEAEDREEAVRPVRPRVEEDEGQRYEAEPRQDIFTISRESYNALTGFLSARQDRDTWSIALWRCNPDWPENRKEWKYIPGQIPVPDGLLEDAVNKKCGPGIYRWQLFKDGRYAGPDLLPPTLRGVARCGWVAISEEGAAEEAEIESAGFGGMGAFGGMGGSEVLMEIIRGSRQEARDNNSQLVDILRANTESFRAQMEMATTQMRTQTDFLVAQMERDREETRRRQEEKDGMWKEIVGLVRDMREGDTRSTGERLLESAPAIIDQLKGAGLFKVPSPGPVPMAAPQPIPAPPAPQPGPQPTEEERSNPVFVYVATLTNKLWNLFSGQVDPDLAAEQLERFGSDQEFDWLMEQGADRIVQGVDALYARFKGGQAPPELLDYTRKVYQALATAEYEPAEDQPGAPPPAAPDAPEPGPVTPASAPEAPAEAEAPAGAEAPATGEAPAGGES